MNRKSNYLPKALCLFFSLCLLVGCGGGSLVRTVQTDGTAPQVFLQNDTSAEARLVKLGNASMQNSDYSIAYYHYVEYLNTYQRGNYTPLAAIGAVEALLAQNKAPEILAQDEYFRSFIRTKSQAYIYNNLMAEAYASTGARLEAVNMMYGAKDMAVSKDEVNAAYTRIENLLGSLSQAEVQSILDGKALRRVPADDLLYHLGRATIIGAGNYALGSQILRTFMQKYPSDKNVPQAEALLSSGGNMSIKGSCVVGCLLPMTGKFERFGKKTLRGVELALTRFQMLNPGMRVQLIIKDTGGTPEQTMTAIQELSRQGVSAIIGPFEEVEVAAQTAQSMGIPIMIISQKEGVEQIGDFVFRNFMSPQMQVNSLLNYTMNVLGINSYAVLYPQENFGHRYMEVFRGAVEARGGHVAAMAAYDPDTRADFGPEIRSLSQQGSFDAIFFPEGEKKSSMVIPQIFFYDLGKRVKLMGTNLWHDETLLRSTGNYLSNSIIVDGFAAESGRPNEVWFAAEFEGLYNESPSFIDAISFDSTYLMIKAAAVQQGATRAQVRNNLMQMQMPETITGFTGFNPAGEAQRNLNLLTVYKGTFSYLDMSSNR